MHKAFRWLSAFIVLMTTFTVPAFADAPAAAPAPLVAYSDGLQPGWFIGGWSKYTAPSPLGDQQPVQVTMDAWNGLTFQSNSPQSLDGYTTLTIVVNGGDKGNQEFKLSFKLGDKVISQEADILCPKGQWVRFDLPLKKLHLTGNSFDTIFLVNKSGDKMPPYYINYVLLQ